MTCFNTSSKALGLNTYLVYHSNLVAGGALSQTEIFQHHSGRRYSFKGYHWVDQSVKDTQMSLCDAVLATHDRSSWRALVRDAT